MIDRFVGFTLRCGIIHIGIRSVGRLVWFNDHDAAAAIASEFLLTELWPPCTICTKTFVMGRETCVSRSARLTGQWVCPDPGSLAARRIMLDTPPGSWIMRRTPVRA